MAWRYLKRSLEPVLNRATAEFPQLTSGQRAGSGGGPQPSPFACPAPLIFASSHPVGLAYGRPGP